MIGNKEFNLTVEYINNAYILIFKGNDVNISDIIITLNKSNIVKNEFIDFLEKVLKGTSWWKHEITYETEDNVLSFKCTNSDFIDINIMPNPTGSSWVLQGVLNYTEKQITETINKLKEVEQ